MREQRNDPRGCTRGQEPCAYELYKACGLPYAHYRCGEFYEYGWGTEKDLEKAKTYYTLAYQEGHGLARKKLKEWNFLE